MPDSQPPTEERRRQLREQAFVLATVTHPSGKVRMGAIDNASETGVALLVHSRVEVGDRLVIAIELGEGEELVVEGDVVRRAEVPRDGPWRYLVGVSIDPPNEALARSATSIRERQEQVWAGPRKPVSEPPAR